MPSYTREVRIPGKKANELFDVAQKGIEYLISKASMGKFDITPNPQKNEIYVKGSLLSATLTCADEKLKVDAQLSLLAAPFKSKLDEGITRWVSKTFNV